MTRKQRRRRKVSRRFINPAKRLSDLRRQNRRVAEIREAEDREKYHDLRIKNL